MKKTLSFFVAMLCVASVFAQWDGTSEPWTQGSGTRNNPYQISTPNQLAYLSDMVSAGTTYAGQYFILTADLDMNSISWLPIGDEYHFFKGHFDGNGHSVTNLIVNNANYNYAGLFGRIDSATVQQLVVSVNITGSHVYSGGVAGSATRSIINACSVSCNINGGNCGGILGYASDDTLVNCNVYGSCYGTNVGGIAGDSRSTLYTECLVQMSSISGSDCGGIIGRIGTNSTVNNVNNCEIIMTGSILGSLYAGGVIGGVTAGITGPTNVSNCKVSVYGNISNNNGYSGGVIGYINTTAYLSNCNVSATKIGGMHCGGIIGYGMAGCTIQSCEFNGKINSNGEAGGIAGYLSCTGTIEISDCINHGIVQGSTSVGGIVGCSDNTAGTINLIRCANLDSVISSSAIKRNTFVGGIIGRVGGGGSATMCYNRGHILVTGTFNHYHQTTVSSSSDNPQQYDYRAFAAGIGSRYSTYSIGRHAYYYHRSTSSATYTATCDINGYIPSNGFVVHYCYNMGNIEIPSYSSSYSSLMSNIIVGIGNGTIKCCYNAGTLTNGNDRYGVISQGSANNCYYQDNCGGAGYGNSRTAANMKSVSFPILLNSDSTVFDFDANNDNNGYPILHWASRGEVFTDVVEYLHSYSAQLKGHYTGIADSCGFLYRQIGNDGSYNRVMLDSTVTPNQYDLTGLTNNTQYEYCFFKYWDGIAMYGDTLQFTTFPLYTVSVSSSNSAWGSVSGNGTFSHGAIDTLTATAFVNYRFLQWSDGNNNNPRYLTVTQNENITATFGPAIYNLTLASNNNAWGSVSGSGSFNFNAYATITATPAPHYHFVSWSDGNNSNPRTLIVTTDLNLTATFAPDQYSVTSLPNNATWGSTTGSGTFIYGDIDTLTATAFEHYRFTGWNDGNTNNPRYLTVTSDSSFIAMFVYDAYTLTLSSNNQAWGSVSGGGMYEYGQQATATATANEHYHFVEWSDGNSSNPRTLMITADLSLQAVFAPNNYTVTVQSSNPAWGTTTGSGTFAYGAIDTITATPVGSHVFAHWNDGTYSNPRHFTVQGDTTITAVFAPSSCTLTLTSNNTLWGTVSGGGTFQYGQSAYCTAMAETGYHFVQWSDGNTDNPRIYMVEDNTTLTATFAPNQYTITLLANDTTKGTVSGGGVYDYNQSIYIIALPNDGYTFSQWSDGNTTAYRQITVTQDMLYTAVFSDIVYTVTALSNNSTYGYVTGGGQYTRNSTATLTAVPSQGYHFEQWSDGNMQNPRTITVLGNMTYFAQFAPEQYTITVNSANISQGTVSGNGIFSYGTFDTLIANPMPHHHFVQWNDNVTTNPRVISVTADSNFTAYFVQDEQYTITVISNSPSRGSVTGGGSFYLGDQTIITATPYTGCVFNHWNDGDTHSSRQITVTQNMTYTATFSDVIYTLTVQSNNPNYGYVSGGGQYVYNSTATLTAYANNGYRLAQWNDGDTHTTRTITVTSNMTFYAQFVPYEYNVTVNSSNSNQGTATGSGVFEYGTQATIRAYPMPHHHFVRWNDNITTNPRIISVTSDSVFTAYFAQDEQYAINVVSDDQTRGTVSGGGTYFSGEQITITATAFSGYTFSHWSDGNTESSRIITVLTNTTYTAYFAAPMYTVNVSCNENEGSVSGGGTYEQGTTVTVTATPNQGYRFVRWSNGLESDAYSFEIFGNVNLVAYFESINGIEDVDKTFNIAVTGNNVSIYGAEGNSVVITDVVGRSIYTNKKYHGETIDVQCSGVYLVKVGENIAKKIVIIK